MKNLLVSSKSLTMSALAALSFSAFAGSVTAANQNIQATGNNWAVAVNQESAVSNSAAITNKFEAMLKKPGLLPQAIVYLNTNIGNVPTYNATLMVLHLENAINNQLALMDKRFTGDSVQKGISKIYKRGDTFAVLIKRTTDKTLKNLMKEASESGYKLETAEGFFFPVTDYSTFKKFSTHVTADIKAYINIMAVESDQASVKDAALMIGYQQLVNRALAQETFIKQYPNSNRTKQVKALFNSYKIRTFYGVNNTPLFDYENKTMVPNAKKGYGLILGWNKPDDSAYLTLLQKFMDLAANHDYKLTPEIERFRKTNIPN